MTKKQMAQIMAVLRAAYPAYYRNQSESDAINAVNLWYDMFKDDDSAEVGVAVKTLIATKVESYPPTIGAVKEKLAEIRSHSAMDAQEAWTLAAKAAAGNLSWDKLPPQVQRAIGSPNTLREWGVMDIDSFNSVVYSQFVKAYRIHQQREKEMAMLPSDVRDMLTGIADRMALTNGGTICNS